MQYLLIFLLTSCSIHTYSGSKVRSIQVKSISLRVENIQARGDVLQKIRSLGFKKGDTIVGINGKKSGDLEEILQGFSELESLQVLRDDKEVNLNGGLK